MLNGELQTKLLLVRRSDRCVRYCAGRYANHSETVSIKSASSQIKNKKPKWLENVFDFLHSTNKIHIKVSFISRIKVFYENMDLSSYLFSSR
jgi:hypothetical protein